MNTKLLTFDTIDSTNTEAIKRARSGAPEGLCIVARQQTLGRGRHGRSWVSKKDAGLYFSIILRPTIEVKFFPLITLMTGVAVHDTLAGLGLKPDIKWVNDVLIDNKKISGILAETCETDSGVAVIVGIGINIRNGSFSDEMAETATSIETETLESHSPSEVADLLIRHLTECYAVLQSRGGPAAIIDEWKARSTYFSGKEVSVKFHSDTINGVTAGLEENGALRVQRDDGSIAIVHAGDVERLRASG